MEENELIEETSSQVEESSEDGETETTEETEDTEETETEDNQADLIDYDRIESIVEANNSSATIETALDNLAVTDVLMLILALVLGILIVKARS